MTAVFTHPYRAPEFEPGLDWINTRGPARLEDLRGRVVLLDFWTYGCINCRHIQPRLWELERRFPDALTVIGVHAGKFAHERVTTRLAEACDRQGVTHPVVNDRHYRIWREFGVNAWPTTTLIDADGRVIGQQSGEFPLEEMSAAITSAIASAEKDGTLVRGPDPIASPQPRSPGDTLRFPGRVLLGDGIETGGDSSSAPDVAPDSAPDRLWISDTGNGRVLECSFDEVGATATVLNEYVDFLEPQGLLKNPTGLYVADRQGQAVWRVGADGERQRVAGTGELAQNGLTAGRGPDVQLRSPWGIAALGDGILISMAGAHQIWHFDPVTLDLEPWAGTGRENLVDGWLTDALLAQPTGLSVRGTQVAFADSESSAIRIASLGDGVRTLLGTGLFDFGDRDGAGDEVLLQHAEDTAFFDESTLVVADTYNNRLKLVDVRARICAPWTGEAGEAGALSEPAGVSACRGRIAVADTAAHRVVLVAADGSLREVLIR